MFSLLSIQMHRYGSTIFTHCTWGKFIDKMFVLMPLRSKDSGMVSHLLLLVYPVITWHFETNPAFGASHRHTFLGLDKEGVIEADMTEESWYRSGTLKSLAWREDSNGAINLHSWYPNQKWSERGGGGVDPKLCWLPKTHEPCLNACWIPSLNMRNTEANYSFPPSGESFLKAWDY